MGMLSANLWLRLAMLLAVLCHAQAAGLPLHNNKPVEGLNDETRCRWNCTALKSDILKEMKTAITKKKMIRLVQCQIRETSDRKMPEPNIAQLKRNSLNTCKYGCQVNNLQFSRKHWKVSQI